MNTDQRERRGHDSSKAERILEIDEEIAALERIKPKSRSLLLATQTQIQRFDNVLPPGQATHDGHDALYAPHAAWVTGDLDVHDIGWGADGRPVFVNTLFGCLATVSDGHSFRPLWRPPFVSRLYVPRIVCSPTTTSATWPLRIACLKSL